MQDKPTQKEAITYVDPKEAESAAGLRLALTAHMPAPYSMSARAVLDHHKVPFLPVLQKGAGANSDLVSWTRHRNAPIAVFEDEPPRTGWLEILNLAERVGSGPSLLPNDISQRIQMIGLINELIGENGLVWQMRILMLGAGGSAEAESQATRNPMFKDYGFSQQAYDAASTRIHAIMAYFTQHAKSQPNRYLIADQYTALDIYWAYFSLILQTLPEADCPMPKGLRHAYDSVGKAVGGCDAKLIACRDYIFAEHLSLPMTF